MGKSVLPFQQSLDAHISFVHHCLPSWTHASNNHICPHQVWMSHCLEPSHSHTVAIGT